MIFKFSNLIYKLLSHYYTIFYIKYFSYFLKSNELNLNFENKYSDLLYIENAP